MGETIDSNHGCVGDPHIHQPPQVDGEPPALVMALNQWLKNIRGSIVKQLKVPGHDS